MSTNKLSDYNSNLDYFRNLKNLSNDEFDENEVALKMQTVSSLLSDEMDAMERTLKISKLKDNLNENIFDKIKDQKDKWLVMLLFKVCNDIDPTRMRFIQLSVILQQNGILNNLDFLRNDNNHFDDQFDDNDWDNIDDDHFNDENKETLSNNLQLIKLPTPYNHDINVKDNEITARSVSMNQITTRYYRDFEEIKCIGFGSFGTVHLSKHKLDKKIYAIKKIIYKHSPTNHDQIKQEIMREVTSISSLNHQNIVRYYGSWIEPFSNVHVVNDNTSDHDNNDDNNNDNNNNNDELQLILASDVEATTNEIITYWTQKTDYYSVLFLQTEYCGNYNLKQLIQSKDRMPEIDQIMDIFGQILLGISHIHSHQILHRDLKPENIFLIKNCNKLIVKIGDFGLSKSIKDNNDKATEEKEKKKEILHLNGNDLTNNIGTFTYAAPEQLTNNIYGTSVDIYSMGIILFELIQKPLFGQERLIAIEKLKNKQEIDKERIDIIKFGKVIQFILNMTVKDPSLRPTSYSLLANDYIKKYWTKNMIENAISMQSNDLIDPVHDITDISTEIE